MKFFPLVFLVISGFCYGSINQRMKLENQEMANFLKKIAVESLQKDSKNDTIRPTIPLKKRGFKSEKQAKAPKRKRSSS